jgi:DNA polymerase elongation subunit (family B)
VIKSKVQTDYILYADTDSLYLNFGQFLDNNIGSDWRKQSDDEIIKLILDITGVVESYINERAYRDIQRKAYNSPITDFRIVFKQEVVAKAALFVKKKKYSLWHVNEEGAPVDKIKTTGLEIIRSDTPESVRPMLRETMEMILKNNSDNDIKDKIAKNKKELSKSLPEEIAANIGIHELDKYINEEDKCVKGTPWHVKGVAVYRALLKHLKIDQQYEEIETGAKAKVVYLKKNQFGFDAVSFNRWPKEFDKVVQVDMEKMIERQFTGKIKTLLEPMQKEHLLDEGSKGNVGMFFK